MLVGLGGFCAYQYALPAKTEQAEQNFKTTIKKPIEIGAGEFENAGEVPEIILPRHFTGDQVRFLPPSHGYGTFSFINGTSSDAVALLVGSDGILRKSIYVRASETGVMTNIPSGEYWVKVAQGLNWSDEESSFQSDESYFAVPHSYRFTVTKSSNEIEYDRISLTLQTVPDGNVIKESIGKGDFQSALLVH